MATQKASDTTDLEVVSLDKILRIADIPWHVRGDIAEWVEDENVPTPAPIIKVNGEWHWEPTESNAKAFTELVAVNEWLEAEQRQRALDSVVLQCSTIVDTLIELATFAEKRNARCYNRNRGNSMQDGRRRAIELSGMIDFMYNLLNKANVEVPQAKQREISNLYRKARDHVNMQ